jgi:ABC-type amino acid transport substrate-binding protein
MLCYARIGALALLAGNLSFVAGVILTARPASAQKVDYRLVEPGHLTVGTYGTGIPAIIVGPGDKLSGLDGVLVTAFARDHALEIKLYQTTFASQILAVEQGKIDVGTFVFYTPERAKHVYYTLPFWVSHTVIFTLKSTPYTGPKSMEGKKVGTVIGFVWAPYLQKWSATGGMLFPDQTTVAQALLNGQIDGYVNGEAPMHTPPLNDSPDVVAHAVQAGDFGFPEALLANLSYNIINCDNRGLATAMDQELVKMHDDAEWAKVLKDNGLGPDADVELKVPTQGCSGG